MGLFFTGSWNQALLAMVIQEARQVADVRRGGFVGRTAVQKMMYFLKVTGVPMSYRFELHHYGPFCDEILMDVEWLLADGVIRDQSPSPRKYSDYTPEKALEELISQHKPEIDQLREKVRLVVHPLAPMRPERLVLVQFLIEGYRRLSRIRASAVVNRQ